MPGEGGRGWTTGPATAACPGHRVLEHDGLITRTSTGNAPSRVEYALTPLGAGLREAMLAVVRWAEENIDRIDAARTANGGNCVN